MLGMDLDSNSYTDKLDISVSGTTPTGGYLNYENSILKDGCLTMDEYKVTIENGEVTTTEKGSCESISLTACDSPNFIPSPESWFIFDETTGTITGINNKSDEHPNGYNGETDVTVPCKINDIEVKKLSGIFTNENKITSVTIPDTVVTITNGSFANNPINKLNIGNSVEIIEQGSFSNGMIDDGLDIDILLLPDSLRIIQGGAFSYAGKINKLVLGRSIEKISESAFGNSKIGTLIFLGGNKTLIENSSFCESQINLIIFEEGVEKISNSAFDSVSLKTVTFPNSLKTLTNGAFWHSTIEQINFGTGLETLNSSAFGNIPIKKVILPEGIKIFSWSFFGTDLEEITFPQNTGEITNFGDSTNYPNLKTIHNNTGKEYDWNDIMGNDPSAPFETGTVTREDGSIVTIVKD